MRCCKSSIEKTTIDILTYLDTQIKEKNYLGPDGLFVTEEEYPKFVRQEIIVNAVTHRAYNISGTDIQIKMFVDRMCRELESAGLRVPEYRCNAFMLQTVIYNANAKKLAIEAENPAIGVKKLAIEAENPAIGVKKLAIGVEKLAIDTLKLAITKQKCSEPTQKHMMKVYENIDANQIFGTSEITNILGCSDATARRILSKFRAMNVVREVKGRGKGKYRFVNEGE